MLDWDKLMNRNKFLISCENSLKNNKIIIRGFYLIVKEIQCLRMLDCDELMNKNKFWISWNLPFFEN